MMKLLLMTLLVMFVIQKTECRNQGCSMLVLVDDTVMSLVQNDQNKLKDRINIYIKKLNMIYQSTILKDPPNNNVYFYVKHVTLMQNFIPNCLNKQVENEV